MRPCRTWPPNMRKRCVPRALRALGRRQAGVGFRGPVESTGPTLVRPVALRSSHKRIRHTISQARDHHGLIGSVGNRKTGSFAITPVFEAFANREALFS